MATRSSIIIKKGAESAILYHHLDGYYEGVGEELNTLLDGTIPQEFSAADVARYLEEKDKTYEYEEDEKRVCHTDIEYLYVVVLDEGIIGIFGFSYLGWYDTKTSFEYINNHLVGEEFNLDNSWAKPVKDDEGNDVPMFDLGFARRTYYKE